MILLSVLLLASNSAPSRGLEDLEHALARTPPVSTGFVEYRFSHLLKKPLRSNGKLEYRADGVLARIVDSPYHEVTEVQDNQVRITRGDHPMRTMQLDRAPQLRVLLASFRALLEGHLTPLRQDFDVTLVDDAPRWTLTLKPRDAQLAKHLAHIDVHGAADRPTCMEAVEPDDDAAFTLFSDAPAVPSTPTRAGIEKLCRASDAPGTPK